MKNFIYVFVTLIILACTFEDDKNLTEAYFISPHGLGRTP